MTELADPKRGKKPQAIRPLTVHLTDKQYKKLGALARTMGVSMGHIVRRLIEK